MAKLRVHNAYTIIREFTSKEEGIIAVMAMEEGCVTVIVTVFGIVIVTRVNCSVVTVTTVLQR